MDFDTIKNDVYAIDNDALRRRVIDDLRDLVDRLDQEEIAYVHYRDQLALFDA